MEPIKFPESNVTLKGPPPDVFDEVCGDLPVYTDGKVCVSLWRMTWLERLQALIYGNLWLYVWTGPTQPPVGLIISKTIFIDRKQSEEYAAEKESSNEV